MSSTIQRRHRRSKLGAALAALKAPLAADTIKIPELRPEEL
jgi:hypothetical protein